MRKNSYAAIAAVLLAASAFTPRAHAEDAAAVKAFAALPDWSGAWGPVGGTMFECCTGPNLNRRNGRGAAPAAAAGGGAAVAAAGGAGAGGTGVGGAGAGGAARGAGGGAAAGGPPGAGANYSGRDFPPFKPDWEARYEKFLNEVVWQGKATDTLTNCYEPGFPRLASVPFGRQFVLRPEEVVIMNERSGDRVIFTDGRPHPKDLIPTFEGHSIGHWEGATLVADTVAIKGGVPLDRWGLVLSDHAHVVEHIHMLTQGETGYDANVPTLEDAMTIDDPEAFTGPYNSARQYRKDVKNQYAPFGNIVCRENMRNPIVNGQTTILLPGDPDYTSATDIYPASYVKYASPAAYDDASKAGK